MRLFPSHFSCPVMNFSPPFFSVPPRRLKMEMATFLKPYSISTLTNNANNNPNITLKAFNSADSSPFGDRKAQRSPLLSFLSAFLDADAYFSPASLYFARSERHLSLCIYHFFLLFLCSIPFPYSSHCYICHIGSFRCSHCHARLFSLIPARFIHQSFCACRTRKIDTMNPSSGLRSLAMASKWRIRHDMQCINKE
jgi:hypothetical protein